jgi:hypothetical protein
VEQVRSGATRYSEIIELLCSDSTLILIERAGNRIQKRRVCDTDRGEFVFLVEPKIGVLF